MLNDIERKVYTIVGFINAKGRNATFRELITKTGRNEKQLSLALQSLVDQELIWWDKGRSNEVKVRD